MLMLASEAAAPLAMAAAMKIGICMLLKSTAQSYTFEPLTKELATLRSVVNHEPLCTNSKNVRPRGNRVISTRVLLWWEESVCFKIK